MLGGFDGSKVTICGMSKKIEMYENDGPFGFFFNLDWWCV